MSRARRRGRRRRPDPGARAARRDRDHGTQSGNCASARLGARTGKAGPGAQDRSFTGRGRPLPERPSVARARRPRPERDREGENRRKREDRHFAGRRPGLAILCSRKSVRQRRQVAQRMREPHPCSSSVSGQSGLSTPFSKEWNILQKFRIHGMTIAIDRRKLSSGAGFSWRQNGGCTQPETKGRGNFLFESSVTH